MTTGDIMKHLLPLILIALPGLLLSGCSDANMPKPPPKVPVPKAADSAMHSPADGARQRPGFGRLSA